MGIEFNNPDPPVYDAEPGDFDLVAWNYDFLLCSSTAGMTSGRAEFSRIKIPRKTTVTGMNVSLGVAGSTLTTGQNLAGLYDAAGNRVAVTGDQTTAWGTTGVKTMAFTAAYTAEPGWYYTALLAVGGTPPQLHRFLSAVGANGVKDTPINEIRGRRTSSTSLTALPATIDWVNDCISNGTINWVGLY